MPRLTLALKHNVHVVLRWLKYFQLRDEQGRLQSLGDHSWQTLHGSPSYMGCPPSLLAQGWFGLYPSFRQIQPTASYLSCGSSTGRGS
jgi:hypothetical protein